MSGCTTMQRWAYCDSDSAYKLGYQDIQDGKASMPHMQKGDVCEGEYTRTDFRTDFRRGAATSFNETCSEGAVSTRARTDAKNGYVSRPGMNRLAVCQSHPKYKSISVNVYKSAFASEICNISNLRRFAMEQGSEMSKMDANVYLQYCSTNNNFLYNEFADAYRSAISNQCSLTSMSRRGIEVANNGGDLTSGLSLVSVCPISMQAPAIQAFRSSYLDQRHLIQERKRVEIAKQRIENERLRLKAERERLRIFKAREYSRRQSIARQRARSSTLAASPRSFYNKTRYFKSEVRTSCKVKNGIGVVKFKNKSNTKFNLRMHWAIKYLDKRGRTLTSNRKHRTLEIGSYEKLYKKDYSAPSRARRCKVKLY